MPCTLSTPKRPCVDWTSLPYNIYGRVGERLLAHDNIDDYIAFRATCHDWRCGAINDYPENRDHNDPTCLQPRKWVLLHLQDDLVVLVNVDTGRFISKSIQLLRKHFFIGATGGGLILLGQLEWPHHAQVLNPFTGSVACFKVPVPIPFSGVTAVAVTTTPLMLFISSGFGEILWADQTSECFKNFLRPYGNRPSCMTSFAGQVYAVNQRGSVISSAVASVARGEEQRPRTALTTSIGTITPKLDTSPHTSQQQRRTGRYYLVESEGDLLLVTRPSYVPPYHPIVQKVDTERNKLVAVSSIGNHAIFVGPVRCLSIDADKFQGIKGGCVYFVEPTLGRGDDMPSTMKVYQVVDGYYDFIMFELGTREGCFRPLTLAQVLADYCRSVLFSKLFVMEALERGWDISSDSESEESSSSGTDEQGWDVSSDSESEESSSSGTDDEQGWDVSSDSESELDE